MMGSGSKFTYGRTHGSFGIGVHVSNFPFAVCIGINLLFWYVQIGFGKGYDE